ncbi:glycoside hydrolase N-terminal domain-containing protein, partial [Streptomyces sp. NPDC058424]|uniref:glycoside hydrolase N-terminal domain-containing protein n=1 Tax=Streptomyces sp. NPDC058424 TaxID=3346491 RepID=UPI00366660F7
MTGGLRHGTWEPLPAARWEDAFLSGNGHHGALVFGDPDDDRVIVTHHTLDDRFQGVSDRRRSMSAGRAGRCDRCARSRR